MLWRFIIFKLNIFFGGFMTLVVYDFFCSALYIGLFFFFILWIFFFFTWRVWWLWWCHCLQRFVWICFLCIFFCLLVLFFYILRKQQLNFSIFFCSLAGFCVVVLLLTYILFIFCKFFLFGMRFVYFFYDFFIFCIFLV